MRLLSIVVVFVFFFFKQKTAYEMRISDWSSDVCSSDLPACASRQPTPRPTTPAPTMATRGRAEAPLESCPLESWSCIRNGICVLPALALPRSSSTGMFSAGPPFAGQHTGRYCHDFRPARVAFHGVSFPPLPSLLHA